MSRLIDDYLRELRKNLGHMESDERDAVLAEINDHLTQESSRLLEEDPSLGEDGAAGKAIEAFGPADEIGIAYGGKAGVGIINKDTGERILEVASVTGRVAGKVALTGARGLGHVLKYVGFAVLAMLGFGAIIAVAALFFAGDIIDTFQDDIRESVPRPLYGNHQYWSPSDGSETSRYNETFDVREGVKEFWISIDVRADSGCASISLVDPSGDSRYDSGPICNGDRASRDFNFAEKGTWQLQYQFVEFNGHMDAEAYYFSDASGSASDGAQS